MKQLNVIRTHNCETLLNAEIFVLHDVLITKVLTSNVRFA